MGKHPHGVVLTTSRLRVATASHTFFGVPTATSRIGASAETLIYVRTGVVRFLREH
jgi:hypothetical protein